MADRDKTLITLSAAVDTFGDGLWMIGGGLFFIRVHHYSVTRVGLGLTIAGLIGLPAGIWLARIADRRGPRGTYLVLTLVQAAAFVGMVVTTAFPLFVIGATVAASTNQGAQATRSGIIRGKGGAEAVRFRARLHSVMNVGISLGAALAGVAVAANTQGAYKTLMLGDAATFATAGVLLFASAPVESVAAPATRRVGVLRDTGYLAVAAVDGLVDFQFIVSGYLLPLWVALHTSAPRWLSSPLLLLNTVIVVLFQVRFSKGATEPSGAARSFRCGAVVLAVAAVLFGISGELSETLAVTLLIAAMVVHSVGELLHASGSIGLSFGLAPDHSASEYQAVWSLGMGMARALGPAALTFLCLQGGLPGWLALAAVFVAAGAVAPGLSGRVAQQRSTDSAPGKVTPALDATAV